MIQPQSALPWELSLDDIAGADGSMVAYDVQEPEYIIHACNAYPKLIALLKSIHSGDLSTACKITALLKELGE